MTPEERNLVNALFDRLAALENAQRDPDAEQAIREGLRQAPNALYALVQTALVQDEALKRADAHIRALETQAGATTQAAKSGSFLGGTREGVWARQSPAQNSVWGRPDAPRAGSVPSVRPADGTAAAPGGAPPAYATGAQPQPAAPAPTGPGGSFLGTAAAAAAGMIGGSLLMNSMRSMMGHGHPSGGLGTPASAAGSDVASPWSNASGGNLSREAGLDDIGRSSSGRGGGTPERSQGLLGDNAEVDDAQDAAGEEPYEAEPEEGLDDDSGSSDFGEGGGGDE